MRVLWFADAHVENGQDLSRFDALGKYIVDKKPDCIVQGGDFTSIESLSDWDKDKRRKMEFRRYSKDIEATNEAIKRMFAPPIGGSTSTRVETYPSKKKKSKRK